MKIVVGIVPIGRGGLSPFHVHVLNELAGMDSGEPVAVITGSFAPALHARIESVLRAAVSVSAEGMLLIRSNAELAPGAARKTVERAVEKRWDILDLPAWCVSPAGGISLTGSRTEELSRIFTKGSGAERLFVPGLYVTYISMRFLEFVDQVKESFCMWTPGVPEKYKNAPPEVIFGARCRELGWDIWCDWDLPSPAVRWDTVITPNEIEAVIAHRILDVKYGEKKGEVLSDKTKRAEIRRLLRRYRCDSALGSAASRSGERVVLPKPPGRRKGGKKSKN